MIEVIGPGNSLVSLSLEDDKLVTKRKKHSLKVEANTLGEALLAYQEKHNANIRPYDEIVRH